MSVLTKLFQHMTDKKARAWTDYRALLAEIAAGKEPALERVESVLRAVGKSIQDLPAAVEIHRQRQRWRHELDAAAKLDAEEQTLRADLAKADGVLRLAEEEHAKKVLPIRARLEAIEKAGRSADSARDRLIEGCPYPDLIERSRKLQSDLAEVGRQRAEQTQRLRDLRGLVKRLREQLASGTLLPGEGAAKKRRLADYETEVASIEKELPNLEKRLAALQRELDAARAALLEP